MLKESEMTIREHCDSIRHEVDIARETALENIHKASNTLMTEIDTYERECLSHWTATKESTEVTVEDVSKRMREFVVEQHAYLQSVQARDDEMILRLEKARKLAQELSDRKKELKATMFNDKLASFTAFSDDFDGDASLLGELTFPHIQLPLKHLDIASAELKRVEILTDWDFLLPLNSGYGIVAFEHCRLNEELVTKMTSFDRAGRIIGLSDNRKLSKKLNVKRGTVSQCAPNEFVLLNGQDDPELCVLDSSLTCLRTARCRSFKSVCCNSKFDFGLWDDNNEDVDDYNDDSDEQLEHYSSLRIQVHHLDTLSEAFELRVPAKYTIVRMLSDEHRVVAMSRLSSDPCPDSESGYWFMSIFDLATCNESSGGDNTNASFFLVERHIDLMMPDPTLAFCAFLFDSWLVVLPANGKELVWFDKNGNKSETSTEFDIDYTNLKSVYSFSSSIEFEMRDYNLMLQHVTANSTIH